MHTDIFFFDRLLCADTARYLYAQRSLRRGLELICQVHGEECGAGQDHPHLGCGWRSMEYQWDLNLNGGFLKWGYPQSSSMSRWEFPL